MSERVCEGCGAKPGQKHDPVTCGHLPKDQIMNHEPAANPDSVELPEPVVKFMAWLEDQGGVLVRTDCNDKWVCRLCCGEHGGQDFATWIEHTPECLYRIALAALKKQLEGK